MKKNQSQYTTLSVLAIISIVFLAFSSLMPNGETKEHISATEFSLDNAFSHVEKMSRAPHYLGSKAHDEVRAYLVAELKKLGLQAEIQQGYTTDKWGNLSKPKNVLARIKGTDNSKTLLLLSHYDSDPHSSYGASDAASGVATILEGIRAFLSSKTPPKNDIIILFSDGEELGLNGAELFVNTHPWAKEVGLVLNFEARGSGGPSYMLIETNKGNAKLISEFKKANLKYAVANSLMYSIYKMLPNDTDLTVFREDANIEGFNFAFIDDHFDYHTANDLPENLDKNTLQHQGTYLMPLLQYFANQDISNLKSDVDDVYFNTPFGLQSYPFSWVLPMWCITILCFIVLLVYGLKEQRLSYKKIASGGFSFLSALILGALATYLLWNFVKWCYPNYKEMLHGFTYNGHWYIAFFTALSIGITLAIYRKKHDLEHVANLVVIPIFFWLVICGLIAFYLKGAGFMIIPVWCSLVMLFVLIRQQKPNTLALTILAIPTLYLISPFVQMFLVGLGLKIVIIIPILIVLIYGSMTPIFGFYKHKRWLSSLSIFIAIICFFMAHSKSDFTKERQKPNSLVYLLDTEKNAAFWGTYDHTLDSWTKNFISDDASKNKKELGETFDSKYQSRFTALQEAPVKNIAKPKIEITKDTIISNYRQLQFCVVPQRKVNRIEIFANAFNIDTLKANGILMKLKALNKEKPNAIQKLITYYVTEQEPLEMELKFLASEQPEFTIYESSYDLLNNRLFSIPKRTSEMMPKPFVLNDAIIVKSRIDLQN